MTEEKTELIGLYPEELESFVEAHGLPIYRARQIAAWIYNRGITDFGEMTDLSKALREDLAVRARIMDLEITARQESPRSSLRNRI